MVDGLTLDQLRLLDTVAREGSFSAAARALGRVRSAVSSGVANLEAQVGTALFVRGRRRAELTPAGERLLEVARQALRDVDRLRALAEELRGGLEPRVSLAVDTLFDVNALCGLCRAFSARFPSVELRLDTDTLSGVAQRVLEGAAGIAVVAAPALDRRLVARAMPSVRMIPVAAASHALARRRGAIDEAALATEVQIVLTERGATQVPDQAVAPGRTWRIADLATKHALLLAGLGWGNLPEHLARADVAKGRLKVLRIGPISRDAGLVPLYAVHRPQHPLGPAHRWLLETLAPSEATAKRR